MIFSLDEYFNKNIEKSQEDSLRNIFEIQKINVL